MPPVRTPASLADQIRKLLGPDFDFSLKACLAVGRVVSSATRPRRGLGGRAVRPYDKGLVAAVVKDLGGPDSPLVASELYRMAKFARLEADDPKFVAACLEAGDPVTWTHVMRLLPVKKPTDRLALLRECVKKRLSVRRLRDRIYAKAGYLPPRTGSAAGDGGRPAAAPTAPAVLARRLRKACDTILQLTVDWESGGGGPPPGWPKAGPKSARVIRDLRRAVAAARSQVAAVDDDLAAEAKRAHWGNPTTTSGG